MDGCHAEVHSLLLSAPKRLGTRGDSALLQSNVWTTSDQELEQELCEIRIVVSPGKLVGLRAKQHCIEEVCAAKQA